MVPSLVFGAPGMNGVLRRWGVQVRRHRGQVRVTAVTQAGSPARRRRRRAAQCRRILQLDALAAERQPAGWLEAGSSRVRFAHGAGIVGQRLDQAALAEQGDRPGAKARQHRRKATAAASVQQASGRPAPTHEAAEGFVARSAGRARQITQLQHARGSARAASSPRPRRASDHCGQPMRWAVAAPASFPCSVARDAHLAGEPPSPRSRRRQRRAMAPASHIVSRSGEPTGAQRWSSELDAPRADPARRAAAGPRRRTVHRGSVVLRGGRASVSLARGSPHITGCCRERHTAGRSGAEQARALAVSCRRATGRLALRHRGWADRGSDAAGGAVRRQSIRATSRGTIADAAGFPDDFEQPPSTMPACAKI